MHAPPIASHWRPQPDDRHDLAWGQALDDKLVYIKLGIVPQQTMALLPYSLRRFHDGGPKGRETEEWAVHVECRRRGDRPPSKE